MMSSVISYNQGSPKFIFGI